MDDNITIDKYNKQGYLIYVNNYYIFQPFDQPTNIPMYYRIKKNTINNYNKSLLTLLKETNDIPIKTSNQKEYDFVSVSNYYNKKTLRNMVTINNWLDEDYNDLYNGRIYINVDDYNHLFNKGTYQISVYVKDPKLLDETLDKLDSLGYKTLAMKNALQRESGAAVIRIIKIIVTILLVVTLFFISYFIIKLILKSRNIYFTTIRMLGSPKKVARHLLIIELLTVTNIAYFGFILLVYLNKMQVLRWGTLAVIREFLTRSDYVIIYLITIILSLLISEKYASKVFKKSVMNSYREEV